MLNHRKINNIFKEKSIIMRILIVEIIKTEENSQISKIHFFASGGFFSPLITLGNCSCHEPALNNPVYQSNIKKKEKKIWTI